MTDTLSIIIQIVQCVAAIISICVIFIKPIRQRILGIRERKQDEEKKDEARDEAARCSLRNIITSFYYSKYRLCEIHQYEYENIQKVYCTYKAMGGNSFVDKIWKEMEEWTIIS